MLPRGVKHVLVFLVIRVDLEQWIVRIQCVEVQTAFISGIVLNLTSIAVYGNSKTTQLHFTNVETFF